MAGRSSDPPADCWTADWSKPGSTGTTPTSPVHPSSILRARDDKTRANEYGRFVDDLRAATSLLA